MKIIEKIKIIIFICVSILSLNPNTSYGEKIYEVSPDGIGLNSLFGAMEDIRFSHSSMSENVIVILKDGVYPLKSTLYFDVDDGGTELFSVTYKAESGANPIISGGHIIDNWGTDPEDVGVSKACIDTQYVRNLYAGDKRLARSNHEAFFAEEVYRNDEKGACGLIIDNKDLPLFGKIDGLELNYKLHWRQYYFIVDEILSHDDLPEIPEGKSLIVIKNFDMAIDLYPTVKVGTDNPFIFENGFELMEEGDFYFQPGKQTLYFRNSKNNLNDVLIADLENLVKVGAINTEERVKNLIFDGISFCYSSYDYPSIGGFIPLQGSHLINTIPADQTYTLIPGAIQIENAENIKFTACSFKHLGGNGICIINNTDGITIDNNQFADISGTAISVSDYRHVSYDEYILPISNTTISNNFIKDIGVEFTSCCGIEAFYVENLTIAHNELYDMPYTGISVGFGWSMEPKTTSNVKVLCNKIIGDTQKCFDGGAIYSLSHFGGEGLLIEGNYIDEISKKPLKDSQGAIYTDEGSSNVRINNNVVMTERRWFFFHKAGRVEVDSMYVRADNHQTYGGVNAPSGGTEISYVENGEHIFDLPCDKAESIANNAGIKLAESGVYENIDYIRSGDERYFKITKIPNGFSIEKNRESDESKICVVIYGIDSCFKGSMIIETNVPINVKENFKGLHIVKVMSGSHCEIFKILL